MPQIQLFDFQKSVEEKFGDFEVIVSDTETLLFVPALRMSKAKRKEFANTLDIEARAAVDNGDDIFDVYQDVFRVAAKKPTDFKRLAEIFGDDPALWQELFQAYIESTSAGEA